MVASARIDAAFAGDEELGYFFNMQDVKVPVASSLHDISKIIGPALASHTMFPVVDRLLKQESQILNLAVISHFASFVGVFDTHIRQSLIDFFLVLQNDPKKWRVRY